MHIPDGILSPAVTAITAVAAAAFVLRSCRQMSQQDAVLQVALPGCAGAFVFAAQMVNFPVGPGASGHLLGAALLTMLLGRRMAMIILTAILILQALVFQDGGVLALGANVLNLAVAGSYAAWLPCRWLSGSRANVVTPFVCGFVSVFVSAGLMLVELAISGVRVPAEVLSISSLLLLLCAVLEGCITMAVWPALRSRSSLVPAGAPNAVLGLLLAGALVLSTIGAVCASALPDVLESMTNGVGFGYAPAPFANYEVAISRFPWLRTSLAGLAGLTLTGLSGALLARVLQRRLASSNQ
jgi:cobalt/nickel transport system permease protein